MAEGKKSFTAYCDWNAIIEKLSDEEAGKLMKMLFAYVNDLNPIAPDRITELVFEPIKATLKRDLNKWRNKSETNSYNGKLGGRPKKANGLEINQNKANGLIEKRINPEKAVSVSVSVRDSVTDSVSVRESVIETDSLKNKNAVASFSANIYPTFDDFWNHWPEKVAKQTAQKSWTKLSQKEKERVMMHIEPFIQAKHLSGQHLPHAATYLNQKRFNDEMLPQATKSPIVQADGRMKIDDIAAILKQKAIDKHQNQISHEPTSLSADNARS